MPLVDFQLRNFAFPADEPDAILSNGVAGKHQQVAITADQTLSLAALCPIKKRLP